MELLKHVAKDHYKETGEEVMQREKEEDNVEKEEPLIFSESMLDEFLVWEEGLWQVGKTTDDMLATP